IAVLGTAAIQPGQGETARINPDRGIEVRFGDNGQTRPAARIGNSWTTWRCTGSVPPGSTPGGTLTITATAFGQERPGGDVTEPWTDIEEMVSVVVVVEATPPVVSIDPFVPEVTPGSLPYQVTLAGSAHDEGGSGIRSVQLSLDGGPFADTHNVTGDWSRW